MSKTSIIVSTLFLSFVTTALYAYYYMVTNLALPETYDAYARNWQFQLLMSSIFRLPLLILAACLSQAVAIARGTGADSIATDV